MNSLEDLKNEIRKCNKCPLYKMLPDGCTPVCGVGPVNAKIFCLAESPGKDEVIMDEPLVGICGKYFDKLLAAADIKRSECYIDNLVHCRCTDNGKKNRPPKKDEINACLSWISQIILTVNPSIIISFGKHPAEYLLKRKVKKLMDEIGKINYSYYLPCGFICSLHPSYVMQYGKNYEGQVIEHLKLAKKVAYGL